MKRKITEAQLRDIIQEAVMNELSLFNRDNGQKDTIHDDIMRKIIDYIVMELNPDIKMDSVKINKLMKAAKIIRSVAFGQ
jgi:hypothetical protein